MHEFEDEKVAKWFGFELARLIVDSCYRDLSSSAIRRKDAAYSKAAAVVDWKKVDCLAVSLMARGEFQTFQKLTIDFSNQFCNSPLVSFGLVFEQKFSKAG
jgi:hypothetical protein